MAGATAERVAGAGWGIVQWLIRQLFARVLIVRLEAAALAGLVQVSTSDSDTAVCSCLSRLPATLAIRCPLPSFPLPCSCMPAAVLSVLLQVNSTQPGCSDCLDTCLPSPSFACSLRFVPHLLSISLSYIPPSSQTEDHLSFFSLRSTALRPPDFLSSVRPSTRHSL